LPLAQPVHPVRRRSLDGRNGEGDAYDPAAHPLSQRGCEARLEAPAETAAHAARDQRDEEKHDRDEKYDLGDADSGARDPAKTEYRRNGDAAGSVHDLGGRELTSVSSAAAPTSSAARSEAAA